MISTEQGEEAISSALTLPISILCWIGSHVRGGLNGNSFVHGAAAEDSAMVFQWR